MLVSPLISKQKTFRKIRKFELNFFRKTLISFPKVIETAYLICFSLQRFAHAEVRSNSSWYYIDKVHLPIYVSFSQSVTTVENVAVTSVISEVEKWMER